MEDKEDIVLMSAAAITPVVAPRRRWQGCWLCWVHQFGLFNKF